MDVNAMRAFMVATQAAMWSLAQALRKTDPDAHRVLMEHMHGWMKEAKTSNDPALLAELQRYVAGFSNDLMEPAKSGKDRFQVISGPDDPPDPKGA